MRSTAAVSVVVDEAAPAPRQQIGIVSIFLAFLSTGATSFGGGVIAYLRSSFVCRRHWLDDVTFLELLGISQTLPGLNATNMAVLIGDRLRGAPGAAAALLGLCLPGALLMYAVGVAYQIERDRALVEAALGGVAAAAVGLILATILQVARKSLSRLDDLVFVALTVLLVNQLHVPVARVLIVVGSISIVRSRIGARKGSAQG